MAVSKYLQTNWIMQMTESLALLHPELERSDIEEFVISLYQSRYTDNECMIYNSYENTVAHTTLGTVCDWIKVNKPLISESGVFFYQKAEKSNVNIEIIKEGMLDARDVHKAEKFEAMQRGDAFTAAVKDIQQGNDKKAANSGYGAEGQSSSFLFNVHSAMSVTAAGRGQLSTAILCFENLFADNVLFWNMDEFFSYILHVVKEKKEWKYDTYSIINKEPTKKQWVKRFTHKFLHYSLCDTSKVETVYDNLNSELRARTYYKSNLRGFLRDNWIPCTLIGDIAETDCEFINPNEVPKQIEDKVKYLNDLVVEFVNYKYSSIRYQDKARYERRKVVIVAD